MENLENVESDVLKLIDYVDDLAEALEAQVKYSEYLATELDKVIDILIKNNLMDVNAL